MKSEITATAQTVTVRKNQFDVSWNPKIFSDTSKKNFSVNIP